MCKKNPASYHLLDLEDNILVDCRVAGMTGEWYVLCIGIITVVLCIQNLHYNKYSGIEG